MQIPLDLKMRCAEMSKTKNAREVFDGVFSKEHPGMGYETFRHKLRAWKRHAMADTDTLNAGTYSGFAPYSATVQVGADGDIRQAWIRQSNDNARYEQLLEFIQSNVEPSAVKPSIEIGEGMLEIPLFDMHFGVATMADYYNICADIVGMVASRHWDEINIIIGQDLIHNNDMRGHTAKGTPIQKVDIPTAWADAWDFWCNVIDAAIGNANTVHLRYSKGNHDECISWCFAKALKARYRTLELDESFKQRKAVVWRGCFIGYGHCEYTGKLDKLFRDFVMDFPSEFAAASVREIHTGHFHSESTDCGFIVRRLASAVPSDEWADDNGFIGSHKRFQLFEYAPDRLKAIHYV